MPKMQSILVVDKEEDIRSSIAELVRLNFGTQVRTVAAEDGASGLSKATNQTFGCIITELDLPKKNGLPLISAIRSSVMNEVTPIIIVSDEEEKEDIASQFSFIESLGKPFDFQKLMDLIFKFIGDKKNSKKVSANLFNRMIAITQTLITEISAEEVLVTGSPFFKNNGTPLTQDLILEVGIEMGKIKNNFAIAFYKEELIHFQQIKNFHSSKSARSLVKALAQVIFNNITEGQSGGRQSALKISHFKLSEDGLIGKKGVVINLENNFFKIGVFANAN